MFWEIWTGTGATDRRLPLFWETWTQIKSLEALA